MADQKHIIKRQVIELEIPSGMDNITIQDRISRIYHDRIVPLLSEYLDQKSPGASVNKIGHLELDLGRVNIDNLEYSLIEKIELELQRKLPRFNVNAEMVAEKEKEITKAPAHSDIDLIVYFLQTGSFPWWAEKISRVNFENAFENVLTKDTSLVKSILKTLFSDDLVLTRFIYTSRDEILDRLIEIYFPGELVAIKQMQSTLFASVKSKMNTRQFRENWWRSLLKSCFDEKINSGKNSEETIFELFMDIAGNEENEKEENEFLGSIYSNLQRITFLKNILDVILLSYRGEQAEQVNKYLEEIRNSFKRMKAKKVSEGWRVREELEQVAKYAGQIRELLAGFERDEEMADATKRLDEIQHAVAVLKEQGLARKPAEQKEKKGAF